ncbi:YkuJ family protein [Fructobacillus ficulneus]|uniref:DUF1797 family protein n=1 Tax=Fructobacillus ficulneus TaxID=157463 RepID=A0A0K8MI66_9LACO|nr:YkuJ family protein [Fructobacillus ficulneus]GAO99554.1 hypothetical protein FFIC_230380 [Fructobacillus ficulneus]
MDEVQNQSILLSILNRLFAMVAATDGNLQERRFDAYGVEILKVIYNQETQVWIIEEHRRNKKYQFDDVDLVAIEIYDLLFDVHHTF